MTSNILLGILIIVLILLSVQTGYLIGKSNFKVFKENSIYSLNNTNCTGLNLINTEQCLRESLSLLYKYNISNTGKKLNLEQLKTEGGVCSHYSDWYRDNIVSIGGKFEDQDQVTHIINDSRNYYTTQCEIRVDTIKNHIVTIISNNEGYCILDQLNNFCWRFEN